MVNLNENNKKKILEEIKRDFYKEVKNYSNKLISTNEVNGFASSIIIPDRNYPKINLFSVSNENKETSYFNTSNFIKKNYDEILKFKAKNIFGNSSNIKTKEINSKILEDLRDIYKSKKEINFESKFKEDLKFNKIVINKSFGILGAKNELEKINVGENISISKDIEKLTTSDIKSKKAIIELYLRGINENQIINLISLGSFGISFNKKLVPTKWANSLYDKTIENYLFAELKKFRLIKNYELYYHREKGNYFLIILIPEFISGNLIEIMDNWSGSDYFNNENRLDSKEPRISGAYYASKLSIFESLFRRKKQASIIMIRNIINYEIPLGVIFVRETIRETLKKKPILFSNIKDLEKFIKENFPQEYQYFKNSKLLLNLRKNQSLYKFI